jgi:hypothetical protein
MTTYDSKAEAAAAGEFARLGCIRASGHFPQTFTDADGTEFRAKPDFYHPGSGLFIEFKAAPLNSKTTKATAERAEASQLARKGLLTGYDRLKCGWNHCKAKQAIVQRKLTPQTFVVVFKEPPTFREALGYVRAGIVFIPLYALPSYLLHARLAKADIQTGFRIRYDTEEAGPVVLALGPYDPAGCVKRAELA